MEAHYKHDDPEDDNVYDDDYLSTVSDEVEDDWSIDEVAADSFHEEINLALNIAYPELLERVKRIRAADWHRKQSAEIELANSAVIAAIRSMRKSRTIPNDLVAYLVTTARNLAFKDWRKRENDPFASSPAGSIEIAEQDIFGEMIEAEGEADAPAALPEAVDLSVTFLDLVDEDSVSQDSPSAQHLALTAAIDLLPERQRQVLMLYADRGSSSTQRALAAEIGITEKNFQMTLARAGKSVCKFLKDSGFEVSDAPTWVAVGYQTPRK